MNPELFLWGMICELWFYLLFSLVLSSIIAIWAYLNKLEGSQAVVLSIIPSFLIFYYYDALLFISFFYLITHNLLSLSKYQKQMVDERNNALIRSARLELDLLKKSLQPHFLMNTLTSIIEWIERDPAKSVHFVEALAEEFKLLIRISDKKLIPLKQELALCDLHLNIMNMRKNIRYIFDYSAAYVNTQIPPGVIHTIIENGISHSTRKEMLRFTMKTTPTTEGMTHEIITEGSALDDKKVIEGTGTKYIKARLAEAFDRNWDFQQQQEKEGWVAQIKNIRR